MPTPGALACYAAILLGLLAFIDYRISVTLLTAALLGVAFVDARARLAWFCLGGLVLFDSGAGLGPAKLAYAASVGMFAAFALNSIYRDRLTLTTAVRAILAASIIYLTAIALFFVPMATLVMGVRPADAIRDGVTHALPPVAVFLGVAAGIRSGRQARVILTSAVASLAVAQFALTWMTRRGVTQDQFYFLGSRAILSLAFLFFIALAASSTKGLLFGAFGASAALGSAALSGNRSSFLMLIGIPAMAIGAMGKRIPLRHLARPSLLAGLVTAAFMLYVIPRTPYAEYVGQRIQSLISLITDGVGNDASGASRLAIMDHAMALFAEDRLVGIGIGSIPNVDSPAVYLAKFGILGTVVIGLYFVIVFASLHRVAPPHGIGAPLALGWGIAVLVSCISAAPTSDPGLAIGVALLTLVCCSEAHHGATNG